MMRMNEYQGLAGQSNSTYSNLRNLYTGQSAQNGVINQGIAVVPKWCPSGAQPNYPPRIDTLTLGSGYCGAYRTIMTGYPYAGCNTCATSFVQRKCDGNIDCSQPNVTEGYRRY